MGASGWMMATDPRIPDKQYFRIGEVARIAGVQPHVLRFWETEFRSLRPSKTESNRRLYNRRDVELVLRIRDLLYEQGYTIPGARRQLQECPGDEEAEDPALPARTRTLLQRIRNEVEELLQLVRE
jgi:DNA-binding transcriptional MerR regulator